MLKKIYRNFRICNLFYLSLSPQLGQVHATLLRCGFATSSLVLLATLFIVVCTGGDEGWGGGLVCDIAWTICHFWSFCSIWALGATVATIGVGVGAGIVWTWGCNWLADITWILPIPGIFWTGMDCRKPLAAFIPVGICITPPPRFTPLIMLPCWAVAKFAIADEGMSVICWPWAPVKSLRFIDDPKKKDK